MKRIRRRDVLRGSLGLIGAAAAFLYPGARSLITGESTQGNQVRAQEPNGGLNGRVMEGPDPGFATGAVIAIQDNQVTIKSDIGERIVRFAPGATVWKESQTSPKVIQLGDWVDARGTPQPDGSLLARNEWVWINIGRLDGVVVSTSPDELVVSTAKGIQRLEFSDFLEVVRVDQEKLDGISAIAEGVAALSPGTTIGAVGVRLQNGGFRATRIWTSI